MLSVRIILQLLPLLYRLTWKQYRYRNTFSMESEYKKTKSANAVDNAFNTSIVIMKWYERHNNGERPTAIEV